MCKRVFLKILRIDNSKPIILSNYLGLKWTSIWAQNLHSKTPIPAVTTQHCDYMVTTSAVTMLHSDYMVTTTVTM